MAHQDPLAEVGAIFDDLTDLALGDFCALVGVPSQHVVELVAEGIIEPLGGAPENWVFSGTCVLRARRAHRLQSELGLNLAGVALVLPLLEELRELRKRERILLRRLGDS